MSVILNYHAMILAKKAAIFWVKIGEPEQSYLLQYDAV
jgi:hypothetical protein